MEKDDATRPVPTAPTATDFDRTSAASHPSLRPEVPEGTRIGRYVIKSRVGRGGMGDVYAAEDPELGRRLALKLVNRDALRGNDADAGGPDELLTEARILAQLEHPNIVRVFDTGTDRNRIFIAMEFVEGGTLTQWVSGEERRPWREVLEMFIKAGRGLAAAHNAGVVHRDFKPANVMLDRHGQPRVLDFGLAGRIEQPSSSGSERDDGFTYGTPAYMAPEQFKGADVDARSDQFSFCVALHQALYGNRPFAGRRAKSIRRALKEGTLEPRRWRQGPDRLYRHLLRGLSRDPDARYPDMMSLLAALESDRGLPMRRLVFGAVAAGSLALGAAVLAAPEAPEECGDAAQLLAGVWDEDLRAAVERAFAATGRPYSSDVFGAVERTLDGYTRRWSMMRVDACEARSDSLFDLRMRCLSRRLSEVEAMVSVLAAADDAVVLKAVDAVQALSPLEPCSEAHSLTADVSAPDPAVRDQVDAIRRELDAAEAKLRTGKHAEVRGALEAIVERAEATGYVPLAVDVHVRLGLAKSRLSEWAGARESLTDALVAATEEGYDRAAARGWIGLVRVEALDAHHDEARKAARHARALLRRMGGSAKLEYQLAANLGILAYGEGRIDEAHEHYSAALDAVQTSFPGSMLEASALTNLGTIAGSRGDHRRALAHFKAAAEVMAPLTGAQHPARGTSLNNIAISHQQLGELDKAKAELEASLEIREAALGPKHAEVGMALHNLGVVTADLGDRTESLRHYQRALGVKVEALGADHPSVVLTRGNLASQLIELGRFDEASVHVEAAAAAVQRRLGTEHPLYAVALLGRGRVERGRGRFQSAATSLREALAIREKNPGRPSDIAEVRYELAMALNGIDGEDERIDTLIEQARADLASTEDREPRLHDKIEAFAAQRPAK